jgi:hypothetical protein
MTAPRSFPPSGRAFGASILLTAAIALGCSSSPTPPPSEPASPNAVFGPNDLAPGTHVLVNRQGQWLPATIVQPLGMDRFLVHYDNSSDQYNEAVGPDRIRSMGSAGAAGAAARDYRVGEKVLVTSQNRQLLADVVQQVGQDQWRVHYDGYGPEVAENVGPDRMRRPFAGASPHAVGASVVVDVNGQSVPAKVLALIAADRWLVRFDNFGPQYDQEVGPDRLRAPAAAPPAPAASAPPAPPAPAPPAAPAKPEKGGKKPAEAAGAPAAPSGPPQVGEAVLVQVRGAFMAATVTAAGSGGAWKVKFEGAGGGEEEVAADRVLRQPTSLKGLHFQPNQPVLVEYKGVFVGGKVLKQTGGGEYKIRFDGQGPAEDEVIQVKRLRPR